MKLLRAALCATVLLALNSVANAQTFTQMQWGINRVATPSPICVLNGTACLGQISTLNTTTGLMTLTVGAAASNAAFPTGVTGASDLYRFSTNSFPATSEFGANTNPIVQGLVGAIRVPNTWAGIAPLGSVGYCLTDSIVGCVGTGGFGLLNVNGAVAWGGNFGFANCPEITTCTTGNGKNSFVGYGIEINGNIDHVNGVINPSFAFRGVHFIGDSRMPQTEVGTNLFRAIDISSPGINQTPKLAWNQAINTDDGAASTALSIGTLSEGNNTSSQLLALRTRTAGGVNNVLTIQGSPSGDMILIPAPGALIALQNGSGTNILETGTGGSKLNGNLTTTAYTGYLKANGASVITAAATVPLSDLAAQATNTIVGNATSGSAAPSALAIGSCSTASSALIWTTNTGFGCNTSIAASTANPTASVGLTAVNGSATTAMRSDAAPALSQSIVPTWSGIHTFSAAPVMSLGVKYSGSSSGTVTVVASATAGTPTITWGNTSGTPAVTATGPLAISTTTGNATCTTCATTTNGGALSGTAPVALSAAGAISITGAAGQVLAGASPAFTPTPTLGVAGSTLGSLAFANLTSGSITLQPVAGALGSVTLSLPAVTDTITTLTTGSAPKWTTARTLAGNSVDGSANVAFSNKFIVQGTADTGLSAAQFLGALGTGLLKNTTTTGVLSIASAGTDYLTSVGVSFTGGLISVGSSPLTSNGTIALTVAGTSGGIPYFSSTSGWASSALLAANALMIGGGAGTAPSTTTTGTGVLTALGNSVSGSGSLCLTTSCVMVTPTLGAASATTINKVTITTPASSATLTIADTASLITSGAFSTTLTSTATTNSTLPAGTHTLAGLDVAQTFSALQTYSAGVAYTNNPTSVNSVDASGGAGMTVTNAGNTALAASFSGMIVVNDDTSGDTGIFLLATGTVVLISATAGWQANTTAPTAGHSSVGWNGSAYAIYNNVGTGTHTYHPWVMKVH